MADWGIYEILPGFVLSMISIVVVSLFGRQPDQETLDRFDQADQSYHAQIREMKQ